MKSSADMSVTSYRPGAARAVIAASASAASLMCPFAAQGHDNVTVIFTGT